jgi:hypothetical protein
MQILNTLTNCLYLCLDLPNLITIENLKVKYTLRKIIFAKSLTIMPNKTSKGTATKNRSGLRKNCTETANKTVMIAINLWFAGSELLHNVEY